MVDLKENELELIDAGALAGSVAGGILGGTVGLLGTTIYGCATGTISANNLWKGTTAGALSGAAIGIYAPM